MRPEPWACWAARKSLVAFWLLAPCSRQSPRARNSRSGWCLLGTYWGLGML